MAPDLRRRVRATLPREWRTALAWSSTFVLLTLVAWNSLTAHRRAEHTSLALAATEVLEHRLVHFDDRLMAIARSALASGDAATWHRTYLTTLDSFAFVLADSASVEGAPSMREAFTRARRARRMKSDLEARAFTALAAGDVVSAQSVLAAPEYHEQTHQFDHALQHLEAAQLEEALDGMNAAQAHTRRALVTSGVLFLLTSAAWALLLQASSRREKELVGEVRRRRRAQHALADSLAMYRTLFESSHDVVLLIDETDDRVVDANERACQILGRPRGDLKGCRWRELEDRGSPGPTDRDDRTENTHLRRADGTTVSVLLRRSHVRAHGRRYVQLTARDQTMCRSLELQLAHAQRVESLGQLACGVAHEFGNLALALSGHASVLRHAAPGASAYAASLGGLEKAAAEARRISRSLLCFSGRLRVERHAVDVRRVAKGTLTLLAHVLPSSIRLRTGGFTGAPIWIHADEIEIEQVLMNLALNARDAMPSGGVLRIDCHTEDGSSPRVVLCVRDTGTGIPEDIRDHIFEPLFTTKQPGCGTGLGLSIVQRIAHQLGGDVTVSSAVGRGTAFTVTLPVTTEIAHDLRDRGDGIPRAAVRPITVALCAGQPTTSSLLRAEFEDHGHRVIDVAPSVDPLAWPRECEVAVIVGSGSEDVGPFPSRYACVSPEGIPRVWIGARPLPGEDVRDADVSPSIDLEGPVSLEEIVRITESVVTRHEREVER